MLRSLHIENLRGIRSLDVEGLGRVNLIVGGNDVGKTTLLAAMALWVSVDVWFYLAGFLSDPRAPEVDDATFLDACWLPMFHGGDQGSGAVVLGTGTDSARGWRVSGKAGRPAWPARFEPLHGGDVVMATPSSEGERDFPGVLGWVPAFVESEATTQAALVDLYREGRLDDVVKPLSLLNPRIEKVELAGTRIYVRLRDHRLPLPYGVLGDGARRLLEIAAGLSTASLLLIDEVENGFHHRTLPLVIDMLRTAPSETQVFATTHREELIRVACERFIDAEDDGLRILRLDRLTDGGHRVVVYTAEEALAGLDAGLELRG